MTATRRQAREWAIQMLTAADLNPPDDKVQFCIDFWNELALLDEDEGRVEVKGKLKDFAEERVLGVLDNLAEIDSVIEPLLENWDMYRLGTVERAVIRMGIWELKYSDVPAPVVINEAVDLTNWFSTPKSRTIVNGVLDKFAKSQVESL
ncbi:MAG: transcription antitermination factor NusB [Kiritimatiellae bacterium]|nr:transcription antitermination factor NusB [Kiritimatiellia bacterium]